MSYHTRTCSHCENDIPCYVERAIFDSIPTDTIIIQDHQFTHDGQVYGCPNPNRIFERTPVLQEPEPEAT